MRKIIEAKIVKWRILPVLALLLCGSSCVTLEKSAANKAVPQGSFYVAMGSSFAAGPGVGIQQQSAFTQCGQSLSNYPHLLTQSLNLKLIDVTCGGATTDDILTKSQYPNKPPQIEALFPAAKLVTITIGGNDINLARDLSIISCNNIREIDKIVDLHCNSMPKELMPMQWQRLEENLQKIAIEAKTRAPNARIIFLDYQAILPDNGNCGATYLKDTELEILRARQFKYASIVKKIAQSNNVEFFSAYEATKGHDSCSNQPFIAGAKAEGEGNWKIPNFHTNQEGMKAIADGLEKYLSQR